MDREFYGLFSYGVWKLGWGPSCPPELNLQLFWLLVQRDPSSTGTPVTSLDLSQASALEQEVLKAPLLLESTGSHV